MKTEFKVGDRVVTKAGRLATVINITDDWVQALSPRTGLTFLWIKRHDRKLRHANIYDEAGERWRSACAMKRLIGIVNGPYIGPAAPLRHRELWTEWCYRFEEYCRSGKLTSEMEEKQNETESELRIGDIVENHIGEQGRVVKISKRVFVYVKMITGARASRTLCFGKKGLVKLEGLVKLAPKEKEMEPKFKVGDIVKTPTGEFVTVIPLTGRSMFRELVQVRTLAGKEHIFDAEHLTKTNLKDGAAYIQEGYKAPEDTVKYRRYGGHTEFISATEKAVREAYQEPPQPIFRLKHVNGTSGWEGCHFVLVAEDEREMLLKGVDINEAKVEDRVVNAQKSIWTRDYSIGDEIINFLLARGGNFTNKVVDNG